MLILNISSFSSLVVYALFGLDAEQIIQFKLFLAELDRSSNTLESIQSKIYSKEFGHSWSPFPREIIFGKYMTYVMARFPLSLPSLFTMGPLDFRIARHFCGSLSMMGAAC